MAVACVIGGGAAGGLGIDPVLVAAPAPALALAGVSLLLLRAVPAVARLADRVSAAAKRLGAALAGWEIGRRPVRQAGPVVPAVFTVAVGTLALAQYASWQRSARDQAAFAAGADVRVDEPAPVPLGLVAAVTNAPGVTAAMPVTAVDTGGSGEVLAVGARAAPGAVLLRPDLSPLPAAVLWRRIVPAGPAPGLVLPGRPARQEILAGLAPGADAGRLGPAAAAVSVQDASGAVYPVPAGTLPADGRVHGLVAMLSPARRADYPLRLLGLTLSYPLPQLTSPGRAGATRPARLTIAGVAAAPSVAGAFGAPFVRGSALAGWRPAASAPDLASPAGPSGATGSPGAGSGPAAGTWRASPSGAQVLSFQPGYAPTASGPAAVAAPPPDAMLTVTAPAPAAVLPGIATRAFASGNGAGAGATVAVPVGADTVQVKVVAVVTGFPTVTSAGGALVVDQAALQDLLAERQDPPLPVTSWWLRTATGAAPPGLPAGSAVTTRAGQAAALLADPLSAVQQQVMLAVAATMVLLAAVGFAASVAVGLRAGRRQRALLAALGVPRTAQARLACLQQLLLSLPAAIAGLAAGTGLAYLLVPAVTLTADAAAPVPPVLVVFPLGWEFLLAAAVAAIPVLAAAASVARPPRPARRPAGAEAW